MIVEAFGQREVSFLLRSVAFVACSFSLLLAFKFHFWLLSLPLLLSSPCAAGLPPKRMRC